MNRLAILESKIEVLEKKLADCEREFKALYHRTSDVPAPSMAEVWRELPHNTWVRKDYSGRTNVMNEDKKRISDYMGWKMSEWMIIGTAVLITKFM